MHVLMVGRRPRSCAPLALVPLLVAAAAPAAAAPSPHVLYLNFSDGTETIAKADTDDATMNRSSVGAAAPYPAFEWPGLAEGSVRRADLVREIARRVHQAFLPYDVVVTVNRPADGPYTMVVVGGSPALFGFDAKVAGLAFMDCDNREHANVVFAFPPPLRGSLHALFVTVAQESAHAFGLEHTSDPTDIMFPRVEPAQLRFQERESRVFGELVCGRETQSSHRRLLELVGPWPGGDKPFDGGPGQDLAPPPPMPEPSPVMAGGAGGCGVALATRRDAGPPVGAAIPPILALFALAACPRRRGRL